MGPVVPGVFVGHQHQLGAQIFEPFFRAQLDATPVVQAHRPVRLVGRQVMPVAHLQPVVTGAAVLQTGAPVQPAQGEQPLVTHIGLHGGGQFVTATALKPQPLAQETLGRGGADEPTFHGGGGLGEWGVGDRQGARLGVLVQSVHGPTADTGYRPGGAPAPEQAVALHLGVMARDGFPAHTQSGNQVVVLSQDPAAADQQVVGGVGVVAHQSERGVSATQRQTQDASGVVAHPLHTHFQRRGVLRRRLVFGVCWRGRATKQQHGATEGGQVRRLWAAGVR